MRSEGRPFGFGFAGILLGSLITWWVVGNRPETPDSVTKATSPPSAERELIAVASQLEKVVESLAHKLEEWRSSEPRGSVSLSEPSAPNASLPQELTSRLETLEETLLRLTSTLEQLPLEALDSTRPLPELAQRNRPLDLVALEDLRGSTEIEADLHHLRWSYQQVLDTYGQPTRNSPSPGGKGQKWYYVLPGDEEIVFWFVEDRVAKVLY